jgi:hypothetical protein
VVDHTAMPHEFETEAVAPEPAITLAQ